jgi:hypothetical protein
MTQLKPSNLEYAQMLALIEQFKQDYTNGDMNNPEKMLEHFETIASKLNDYAGVPLLEIEPIVKGEPLDSQKMNRFWTQLQVDINIAQDQLNILRAAVVSLYNFIAAEVELARNLNAHAQNKLKTLQLYSTGHDQNTIQLGDFFTNEDFIDMSVGDDETRAAISATGNLTLAKDTQGAEGAPAFVVKILRSSNGFVGNNQEIIDKKPTLKNPLTGNKFYTFQAEIDRHADLNAASDREPNTWLEYESCYVSASDRFKAKNFGFSYRKKAKESDKSGVLVDWAKGPEGGVLHLDLELELEKPKVLNCIRLIPFGLPHNRNHPLCVKRVRVSDDGTDWVTITPRNLWVANDANLRSARDANNSVVGEAAWFFEGQRVKYVRMEIEQPNPISAPVGHVVFRTKKHTVKKDGKKITIGGSRMEGPIPNINDPASNYGIQDLVYNGPTEATSLIKDTEYFDGKRWVIGVRDIDLQSLQFKNTSSIVSVPFRVGGVIDRVALEADIWIPKKFTAGTGWIKFYVSPDDGITWFPISRIQDDFMGIPEIIAFNDPLPSEFREIGVDYRSTTNAVTSIRVKIELSRPADIASATPIVRSYQLKIHKR